ncbi:hypothetical protein FVEN_g12182 [Fusarium venenatum]|uniref:Uncharacterized protein n=1 Tax=Fusarium venenatum TaxID=56646 RepID=A0A2L2TTC1_9HYPO|nr:uncharacterized protein FVRRES_09728 [Fusarium venenatum]KAG8349631.1 hypothetical protein FVEN_g12182 [Fusarium venenatum]KAH6966385.1 hypothetical protein EDB82DRAFT_515702 [Fusarium venenatum]CEI69651.1 unnamed protein product [Fusarium venenatum]
MVGVGKPRLDKYDKILSRLFENLALFHILKRVDGPHAANAYVPATLQDARRRFLKNLSFICDYRKGGDTTTSMALEDKQKSVVFWIAANLTPNDKVISFLTEVLKLLREEPKETEGEQKVLKNKLAKICAEFAAPRLKKECKLLHRATRHCEKYLKLDTDTVQQPGKNALLKWLSQFSYSTETDTLALCQIAYDARHDPQMTTLGTLSQQLSVAPPEIAKTFRAVRHFVGRLAERVRVSTHLVQDSLLLGSLLNSYEIRRVDAPIPAKVPPADGLTNLNSIVKRMLPANDPRLEDMQSYVAWLSGPMNLEEAIKNMYDEDSGQLCVHSEVQMLEEFHRNRRNFVGSDRYIACSKLACLCCKFYFKHHPGMFVEPESHQKPYLNWRPVELPGGRENMHWLDQRRVLAMLSSELGKAVEMQIVSQQQPNPWQPDSMTNITSSMAAFDLSKSQEISGDDEGRSEDSASLAHLNEGEFSDGFVDVTYEHSEDEDDGGVGLED